MDAGVRRLQRLCNYYRTVSRRSIVTSAPAMEKAVEKLQGNPFYEKYADRIASLQKTSPDEFLRRVEEQEKARQDEAKKKFASVDTSRFSSVLNPKEALKDPAPTSDKKLDDIFKTDLARDKSSEEIQAIWQEYHKDKEVISATIPAELYQRMGQCARDYNTFLFPLPRDQGYEFILCQTYNNTVHFTPLLAFQVHKENAPECLTMVHYTEFSDKGIILMRGEYDKTVVNAREAQCLANQYQLYYSQRDADKTQLLQKFTKDPNNFHHMDLVRQLESIGLPN